MVKVNRAWHDKYRMPKRATIRERIKWHTAHAKACACRAMPAKIQKLIEQSKSKPTSKKN